MSAFLLVSSGRSHNPTSKCSALPCDTQPLNKRAWSAELLSRPRRNRKSSTVRNLIRETELSSHNLVQPFFIHGGADDVDIDAMPGCRRLSLPGLLEATSRSVDVGVRSFAIFPKVDDSLKTRDGREAYNKDGLVPRALSVLKDHFGETIEIFTDVALDPYSSMGHDGVVGEDGQILNDETVDALVKQALCQADAGASIVSPSDMMDGRVRAIRLALDAAGHTDVSICSYAIKYASSLYGPFRFALDSAPGVGDKKTYQMDFRNVREALRELKSDENEGADFIMVKPAGAYLDVIRATAERTSLPVLAYQVSGEYGMIKAAASRGWLDEPQVVDETLIAIRRSGASAIFTYFATDAATRWGEQGSNGPSFAE